MGESLTKLLEWGKEKDCEDQKALDGFFSSMTPIDSFPLPKSNGPGLEAISFGWVNYKTNLRLQGSDVCIMTSKVHQVFDFLVQKYGYEKVSGMVKKDLDDPERREFFQPVYDFYEEERKQREKRK